MDLTIEDLKCQTALNYDKELCHCKKVSYRTIYKEIVENKLTTVESIAEKTSASTGCGGCVNRIESLIEYAKKNNYEPLP